MIKNFSPRTALKMMRFWPPFWGAGISVESINHDFTEIVVKMPLTKMNTNYVGTHFGGSLYSMCDPFFMLMLIQHMKKDHIIWDQSASIKFVKPGVGTMRARFIISLEEVERLKREALKNFNLRPIYSCDVVDSNNEVVATVEKQLYIRRKDAKERFSKQSN